MQFERLNEIGIVAVRLLLCALEFGQDKLDAVDRGEDDRHRVRRRRGAVANAADQGLGGVGELTETVEAEKAAGAFDRVNQPENAGDHRGVGRLAFEQHKLRADRLDLLGGFSQEIFEQFVHAGPGRAKRTSNG